VNVGEWRASSTCSSTIKKELHILAERRAVLDACRRSIPREHRRTHAEQTNDGSEHAELLFLLGPAVRQYAGERGDGEIGGGGTIGNGLDDAGRHEGEWSEPADVSFDFVLALGDLLELSSPVRDIARCRSVKSLVQLRVVGGVRDNARDLAIYILVPGWSPERDPSFLFPRKI
jgi:hypothetical protein